LSFFGDFREFFHKLLDFLQNLQIFSEKVARHWQNLNYIALIQAKRTMYSTQKCSFQNLYGKKLMYLYSFWAEIY